MRWRTLIERESRRPIVRYSKIHWAQEPYTIERWHTGEGKWMPLIVTREAGVMADIIHAYAIATDWSWMKMRPRLVALGMDV